MNANSFPPLSRTRFSAHNLLVPGGIALFLAYVALSLSISFSVQTGRPACTSSGPCNNSPWYNPTVYAVWLDAAIIFASAGIGMLVAASIMALESWLRGNRGLRLPPGPSL